MSATFREAEEDVTMSDLSRYENKGPSDLQGLEDGIEFLASWAVDVVTTPFKAISRKKSEPPARQGRAQNRRQLRSRQPPRRRTTIVREIVTIEEDY